MKEAQKADTRGVCYLSRIPLKYLLIGALWLLVITFKD
ncbi:hypothetical protein SOVF_174300 isoform A [Spinacia oleracea]|nr:hypothetical protein SOVF_174300 isoform A [Spinacia oleracea]